MLTLERIYGVIESDDPVCPELSNKFRTEKGRGIYALRDNRGIKSFICIAFTNDIPTTIEELDSLSSPDGHIIVPYTVWSNERGAGREIINKVLAIARRLDRVFRVVTLSPTTDMAKKFHLRNNAVEIQRNKATVNFEYKL